MRVVFLGIQNENHDVLHIIFAKSDFSLMLISTIFLYSKIYSICLTLVTTVYFAGVESHSNRSVSSS